MGPIDGCWIEEGLKIEILEVIESAKMQGVSVFRSCEILVINRRRIVRWQHTLRINQSLANGKPGPREPLHRLLPQEKQQILEIAGNEEYADLSHRILAVTAWEQNLFFVSFSTVYRVLSSAGLMALRGSQTRHNGRSLPPYRRPLTGPNQRWCWDISYLLTYEKGLFLYLYMLLDEYSRKVLSWLVSWKQNGAAAKELLDMGLVEENILDLDDDQRPEVFNDRGRQMKAKSVRSLLEDHRMPQVFTRPRTPDDNPFVESAFSTMKRFHRYPGRFLDADEAREYFGNYFHWYNTCHYHSGINYVTPQQAHAGERENIVALRQQKLMNQRCLRQEVNRSLRNKAPNLPNASIAPTTYNQLGLRSVIDP